MLFPLGSIPDGPSLETNKALLLIDFQNDFVIPSGKLPVQDIDSVLDKLPALVDTFRSKGVIVWIRTEYSQSRTTIDPETESYRVLLHGSQTRYFNPPAQADQVQPTLLPSQNPTVIDIDAERDIEAFLASSVPSSETTPCYPNTNGVEYPLVIRELIDREKDMDIVKTHYSAFTDSSLLLQLRTRTITHLYVGGSLSNISVFATVLDAVRHGLEVTLVEDCLGYRTEQCHIEAMQAMADGMGVGGVDCQELMDDLVGLLGDVIHENHFTSQFQVSLPSPRPPRSAMGLSSNLTPTSPRELGGRVSSFPDQTMVDSSESQTADDLSKQALKNVRASSPPRKRCTSELEELEDERTSKFSQIPSSRRVLQADQPEGLHLKSARSRIRRAKPSRDSAARSGTISSANKMGSTFSTGDIPSTSSMNSESHSDRPVLASAYSEPLIVRALPKKSVKPKSHVKLGPDDKIGEGDSRLILDIMPPEAADTAFTRLKASVQWQKMYHRTGEVPRLVAVQGQPLENSKHIPIYRHPADESPELLPFDSAVDSLRTVAEGLVGHPLNHVLIQWYRTCEDNISEHSDKSLDIVRGSSIVNMSLGAQRTMTLRTKKSASEEGSSPDLNRLSQRVPLPHNSLFVLGQTTNQFWLHSIRADKRPPTEKSREELAFDGERISLTFRHIGTFIDTAENKIWGQGATSKVMDSAQRLMKGADAEREGEAMIRAFGQENHRSIDWDWDQWYGRGFDVVNFVMKDA